MSRLFGFGSNGNGQLGIASDEDTATPIPVHFEPPIEWNYLSSSAQAPPPPSSPFHCFAAGGNHTALITRRTRHLYMTGSNKDSESLLSEPSQVFRSHKVNVHPSRLPTTSISLSLTPLQDNKVDNTIDQRQPRWRSVACGWAFTIAVTEPSSVEHISPHPHCHDQQQQQQVYAWGSGAFGELGLGPGLTNTGPHARLLQHGALDPKILSSKMEIIKVEAGLRHVLLLIKELLPASQDLTTTTTTTESTKTTLIGWGSNRQGQLGQLVRNRTNKQENGNTQSLVPFTEKELRGKFMEPTRIVLNPDNDAAQLVDMACGQNHSLALFSDGSVYSTGSDKYGQLGRPSSSSDTVKKDFRLGFERVTGLPFVDSISCGWSHNAAMDSRVETLQRQGGSILYVWGRNDHGQLGDSAPCRQILIDHGGMGQVPAGIRELRIFDNASSSSQQQPHQHEHHQQQQNQKEHDSDQRRADIISFSCGSEHTLAVTRSGGCYAWGWNEHGNCGTGAGDHEVEGLLDVPSPRKVSFGSQDQSTPQGKWVQGGYGSSWIFTWTL
ncbi:putative E3 ubiquitin-protein ligase herc6 [Podila epigama]|nr:putative E3 ubiquitin-protein ligase herc6 [Podila epigama]